VERELKMSKSPRRAGILAFLAVVVATLVLVAFGCSVKGAIVGTTAAVGSSTSTTAVVPGDTVSTVGGTNTTRLVEGGKTADQWAAEIPDLQKAVDADPTDLNALQALAITQYNAGKYDEAAATYLTMLQIQDDPNTRNNYANVLRDAGKTDQAIAEYEKALAADPTLTVAYLNLAVVYATEKNLTEANKVLDRGIAALSGSDQTRLKTYKDKLNNPTTTT
jgi:thioredoxin-like negative regulator of GroEL